MTRRGIMSWMSVALVGLPLLLALLLWGAGWWVLGTPRGAAWLLDRAGKTVTGSLQASQVEGDLRSGLSVRDLEYRSDDLALTVGNAKLEAGLGLWPFTVRVRFLQMQDVEIATRQPESDDPGPVPGRGIRSVLAALKPGFPVEFHAVEAANIVFRAGEGAPYGPIESLSFSARLGDELSVTGLEAHTPDLAANLDGRVALQPPFDLSADVQGRLLADPAVHGGPLAIPFEMHVSGDPDRVEFKLLSAEDGIELGDGRFTLEAHGAASADGLQVSRAEIQGPGIDVSAGGTAQWRPQVQADMKLVIRAVDLHPWLDGWPAGEVLSGDLALAWSAAGLKIPAARLTVPGTDLVIRADADIDIAAGTVRASIDYENLSWPLADPAPAFFSRQGKLLASGSTGQWQAGGQLQIEWGDYPPGRMRFEGDGNQTSARLNIVEGSVLGGSVIGEANLDWVDGIAWEMNVQASGIDPEPLLPGWPGRLDAAVGATGGGRGATRLDVDSLQGTLRGIPVSGNGGFVFQRGMVTFEDVEIRTNEAVLQLDGNKSDAAGATVNFNGKLPSRLLRGASGQARVAGRFSDRPGSSLLEVQMEADDLAWRGFSAGRLEVSTFAAGQTGAVPAIRLSSSGLAWNDLSLDDVTASLQPDGEKHILQASLSGEGFAATARLALAPEVATEPFTTPWQGVVDELSLSAPGAYRFDLSAPAPIGWSPGFLDVGPLCMREDGGADFCAKLAHGPDDGWLLSMDVRAVPLDYASEYLGLGVRLEQVLKGRLDWRKRPGIEPSGKADFRVSAGRILDLEHGDVLAETGEGGFGFVLTNGSLESGVLDLDLPGNGLIDVDFSIQDVTGKDGKNLAGRAIARLDNLRLIGQLLFPALDDMDARFEADISLGGTLADPAFDGSFKIANGLVRYAPIGLKIENIGIEGSLGRRGEGSLEGQFQAGDGTGRIEGRIIYGALPDLEADIALSGDGLLLFNTESLNLSTGADIKIGLSPQRTDINGRIMVPSARLIATGLALEKVTDSEDLVIETGAGQPEPVAKEPGNSVFGQLEVALGGDVLVSVPEIETRVSGSAMFTWNGEPVPVGDGSYRLRGTVDVYGPSLEIESGSVNFPGIPADNPLLNIRAERDIYGNTQIRSAGISVTGSLKRPVVEAYTVPETNRDRAWTLLITGSDFDQGQGVGGFDVGTYIAPRLYVSYGISLFEDENVLSARYDLKKGFGVKITSDHRETGVDVSYTLDK